MDEPGYCQVVDVDRLVADEHARVDVVDGQERCEAAKLAQDPGTELVSTAWVPNSPIAPKLGEGVTRDAGITPIG